MEGTTEQTFCLYVFIWVLFSKRRMSVQRERSPQEHMQRSNGRDEQCAKRGHVSGMTDWYFLMDWLCSFDSRKGRTEHEGVSENFTESSQISSFCIMKRVVTRTDNEGVPVFCDWSKSLLWPPCHTMWLGCGGEYLASWESYLVKPQTVTTHIICLSLSSA